MYFEKLKYNTPASMDCWQKVRKIAACLER